jgi:tetratricopeptide (TPR) repeat protein
MLKASFVCLNIALRIGWAPLALAVCLPVTAQQLTPDQTRCRNKGKAFSLDVQISGCTAVLQSDVSAGNRAVAYTNRGIAYSGKKDYDRGIADFNEAIRLDPSLAEPYNNRGVAYQDKGDYDRAVADFSEAITIDPSHAAIAYRNRGHLFETQGRREEAIADFRQALAIDPKHKRSRDALKRLGVAPRAIRQGRRKR